MDNLDVIGEAIASGELTIDAIRALIQCAITRDSDFIKNTNASNHNLFCLTDDLPTINLLLEFGLDPNHAYKSSHGPILIPLLEAIQYFDFDIAMRLCQVTNPNVTNRYPGTAVFHLSDALVSALRRKSISTEQTHAEMRQLLSELVHNGHDINALDRMGCSVLLNPIQRNQSFLVRILLEAGAKVNITSWRYPEVIATKGSAEIVELLLQNGLDVNSIVMLIVDEYRRDKKDRMALNLLTVAIVYGNHETAKVLVDHGAKMDIDVTGEMTLWEMVTFPNKHPLLKNFKNADEEWQNNLKERMQLSQIMDAVETQRKMEALAASDLVREAAVPEAILRMIASPLTWNPKSFQWRL